MTPDDFKAWRKAMNFNQTQAAEALGVSRPTIVNYEAGTRREDGKPVVIPLSVALACTALYLELEPWPMTNGEITVIRKRPQEGA